MELRHIRYFLAVVEEMNFTRAAERLGISQPPLSQQIHALEAEVGVPLFRRVRRGVELTEAGEAFLQKTQTFPAQVEMATRAARRTGLGQLGSLRISFTVSAIFNRRVPQLIRGFRGAYPDVELSLVEGNTRRQIELLEKGDVDLAFIRPGSMDLKGLRLLRFENEPMVVALPSVHPLAGRASVRLAEMEGESFILLPRSAEYCLHEEVVQSCSRSGFMPRLVQESPHMTSVVSLVAAEMGVSIVPWSMTQAMKMEGVTYVPIAGEAPVARMALALRRDSRVVAARNFAALAAGEIRRRCPVDA